jgi:hypothetical protein
MIGFIKKLFGGTPTEVTTSVTNAAVEAANSAPYKVPGPAETTPVPLVADKAVEAVVKSIAPAKKKPAPKKQQYAKKAAAITGTKQPGRKPKAK